MRSLLLLSIVLVALFVPALTARYENPRRGVWRMLFFLLLFNAVYLAYLVLLHPELFPPEW